MIAISSSRRPSDEFRRIVKLFSWLLPNSIRIGRGHANIYQLAAKCWNQGAKRLLVLHEKNESLHGLRIYDLEPQFHELTGVISVHYYESRYELYKDRYGRLDPRYLHLSLPSSLSSEARKVLLRFLDPVPRYQETKSDVAFPPITEKNKKIFRNVVSLEVVPLTQTLYRVTLWQASHRYPLLRLTIECPRKHDVSSELQQKTQQ